MFTAATCHLNYAWLHLAAVGLTVKTFSNNLRYRGAACVLGACRMCGSVRCYTCNKHTRASPASGAQQLMISSSMNEAVVQHVS